MTSHYNDFSQNHELFINKKKETKTQVYYIFSNKTWKLNFCSKIFLS